MADSLDEAKAAFRAAVGRRPSTLRPGAKGDLDRAIADYDEAIKLDPKDAKAHKYRGYANGMSFSFLLLV